MDSTLDIFFLCSQCISANVLSDASEFVTQFVTNSFLNFEKKKKVKPVCVGE